MPRPMLRTPETKTENKVDMLSLTRQNTETKQKQQQKMDKMQLDRLLRQPRSKEYMEILGKLDAGGHVHNQSQIDEIQNALAAEFPEVSLSGLLIGYVSKCYLGDPYEVHTLDIACNICEHYKRGQALPDGMEKARSLAIRGGYEFIEVYVDCVRAISADGSVSVIPC